VDNKHYLITYSFRHIESGSIYNRTIVGKSNNPYLDILRFNTTEKDFDNYSILFCKQITKKQYKELITLEMAEVDKTIEDMK
jgi:hypothetical protein